MNLKHTILSATALGVSLCATRAFALDIDIGVGERPRHEVVVQPPPVTTRHWVPETVIKKEERVLVEGHGHERHEERILVEPAHRVKKEERVVVAPERVERRPEQVLVKPATVVRVWVPPVVDQVRVGPLSVTENKREGFYREETVPPVYQTVEREVVVPARTEVVFHEVEIPARYETRVVESHEPRYEVVFRDVVVPGHWEESTYVPPAQVVAPARPGIGLGIDLDLKKHHD